LAAARLVFIFGIIPSRKISTPA